MGQPIPITLKPHQPSTKMNENEGDEGDKKCDERAENSLCQEEVSIHPKTEHKSQFCNNDELGRHSSDYLECLPLDCDENEDVIDSIKDEKSQISSFQCGRSALTTDFESNNAVALKRINEYLHRMLFELLKSDSTQQYNNLEDEGFTHANLERTYKKAFSEHKLACERLEHQTESFAKMSSQLRKRLQEKEQKAENMAETLNRYKSDIARQSSFANGRPLDNQMFENLANRSLDDDLEKERLRCMANKVSVSELEQKIRAKNEVAGGISQIEFRNLEENVKSSDEKIHSVDRDMKKIHREERNLLKMETVLQNKMNEYKEKIQSSETLLRELDNSIGRKRANLNRFENHLKSAEKKPGYAEDGIDAFLTSRLVNEDFHSSKDVLESLRSKLNELQLRHSLLVMKE